MPVVSTIGSDPTGQAYNINADTVAGAIAAALGAEKIVYLTDVEGLLRDVDDPASLISRIGVDELQAMLDDGRARGRHDPEDRRVRARGRGRRRRRPTCSTAASRTCCCWSCSATSGVGTMVTAHEEPCRHEHATVARSCRPIRRQPVTFVRGEGIRAVGRRRQALPRLPLGPGGHEPRPQPIPASPRRSPTQARTLLHVSNLFGTEPGLEVARTLDRLLGGGRADGQVFFCNSGAEANECAIKLARKCGGRGRHVVVSGLRRRSTAARSPRCTPPASREKHEAFQPLPEGFRHVALDDLDALERGARPVGGRGAARAGAGRGRREPGRRPSTSHGVRRAVRRAGHAAHGRRGADRPRPHGTVVRAPALRRPARRRDDGQGARQRRADRRLLGPRRGRRRVRARRPRHDLRRPAAGDRGRAGGARRDGARGRADPGRRRRASGFAAALELVARRRVGARARAAARRRARRTATPSRSPADALDRGLVVNAVTPTALRLAPSLLVSDDEIEEAVAIDRRGAR